MKIKRVLFIVFCLLFCQLNGFTQCIDGKINLGNGFSAEVIPPQTAAFMQGKSYPEDALIALEDLRYVQVKHIGFDGEGRQGELVVHKSVSCEVVEIFKELLLSYHALGLAIDINPLQNPYVRGSVIEPIEGKPFVNREQKVPGMIFENDAAVRAFKKRGWKWGGNWKKTKGYYDLQHFEKPSPLRDEYMQKMKKQSANS